MFNRSFQLARTDQVVTGLLNDFSFQRLQNAAERHDMTNKKTKDIKNDLVL